jgi:hypothetical protein
MNGEAAPDLRIVVALDPSESGPLIVMHPCRCDAPDPESTRMEPIEVPRDPLQQEGRALVTCPECDSHIAVVVAGRHGGGGDHTGSSG